MSLFLIALKTVLPLFIAMAIGIVFVRIKSIDVEKWSAVLNDYALWIGFPALIFAALSKTTFDFGRFGALIGANSLYIVLSILLAFPIAKFLKIDLKTKRTLFLALAFSNVSYLGIPVLLKSYGNSIMPEAAMISAVYLFWLFTLCIFLVEYYGPERQAFGKQIKSFISNPLLLSVIFGMLFSVYQIKVPEIAAQAIDLFANSVTAIVLFSLGIFLGSHSLGKIKEWIPVVTFSIMTLLILPGIFYLVSSLIYPVDIYKSWILEAAMPMGLTPYVLSVKYKLNTGFASKVVVLSTILSIMSIPFWILILK